MVVRKPHVKTDPQLEKSLNHFYKLYYLTCTEITSQYPVEAAHHPRNTVGHASNKYIQQLYTPKTSLRNIQMTKPILRDEIIQLNAAIDAIKFEALYNFKKFIRENLTEKHLVFCFIGKTRISASNRELLNKINLANSLDEIYDYLRLLKKKPK